MGKCQNSKIINWWMWKLNVVRMNVYPRETHNFEWSKSWKHIMSIRSKKNSNVLASKSCNTMSSSYNMLLSNQGSPTTSPLPFCTIVLQNSSMPRILEIVDDGASNNPSVNWGICFSTNTALKVEYCDLSPFLNLRESGLWFVLALLHSLWVFPCVLILVGSFSIWWIPELLIQLWSWHSWN